MKSMNIARVLVLALVAPMFGCKSVDTGVTADCCTEDPGTFYLPLPCEIAADPNVRLCLSEPVRPEDRAKLTDAQRQAYKLACEEAAKEMKE